MRSGGEKRLLKGAGIALQKVGEDLYLEGWRKGLEFATNILDTKGLKAAGNEILTEGRRVIMDGPTK